MSIKPIPLHDLAKTLANLTKNNTTLPIIIYSQDNSKLQQQLNEFLTGYYEGLQKNDVKNDRIRIVEAAINGGSDAIRDIESYLKAKTDDGKPSTLIVMDLDKSTENSQKLLSLFVGCYSQNLYLFTASNEERLTEKIRSLCYTFRINLPDAIPSAEITGKTSDVFAGPIDIVFAPVNPTRIIASGVKKRTARVEEVPLSESVAGVEALAGSVMHVSVKPFRFKFKASITRPGRYHLGIFDRVTIQGTGGSSIIFDRLNHNKRRKGSRSQLFNVDKIVLERDICVLYESSGSKYAKNEELIFRNRDNIQNDRDS